MSAGTVIILLIAAIFHSTWNTLIKKSRDKQVFTWMALAAFSVIFCVPFCFTVKAAPIHGWVLMVLSGSLEAAYFFLLASAYKHGDLSLVYPLSRGLSPVFVAIIATIFLGEVISLKGAMGIIFIVFGIYTIHIRSLSLKGLLEPFTYMKETASKFAILTGVTTALYSTVDKAALNYVDITMLLYMKFFTASMLLLPFMLSKKRELIKTEWKANSFKVVIVALLLSSAYGLVLVAMSLSQVSYTSAVREVSIVFGCIIGTVYLKEKFAGKKILGTLFIFAGILFIAV
ncbi:MAG: EamA family transporter [Solirubrobacterales bacterium]